MYKTPEQYYYRLHHPRPRFKSDIENVLGYIAFSIAELDGLPEDKFVRRIQDAIRNFRGNERLKIKTINNWRTEISAIFSMLFVENGVVTATNLTKELANTTNLRKFFLRIVTTFQYPAGFLKNHEIVKLVGENILFHPLLWLSQFFTSDIPTNEKYLTDVEFCHCVLNDLRVSRDHEDISVTAQRIIQNRLNNVDYLATGDVKRYALDLLDYCVLAGIFLKDYNGKYFLRDEKESPFFLNFFRSNAPIFNGYSFKLDLSVIAQEKINWVNFVNEESQNLISVFEKFTQTKNTIGPFITKEIGDKGEALTVAHEKIWLASNGRFDLSKLVKHMPTQFAVGYDVLSRELDATMRHIEVKTTISQKDFTVNRVHLTSNEWAAAESHRSRYYIYRLQLSDESQSLWVIQDPVGLYKQDRLRMIPRDGADLFFDQTCYNQIELLKNNE